MQTNISHTKKNHQFHLVDPSPWPISVATSLLIITSGAIMFWHGKNYGGTILSSGIALLFTLLFLWWRDVVKEGRNKDHTLLVQRGLRIGMSLFILSEIVFFSAFFWALFKAMIYPVALLDGIWPTIQSSWPPAGIETFDPWDLPFINTLILLLSGTTVTWAHYAVLENNQKDAVTALTITVLLGIAFSALQALEYAHAPFTIKDGIYSSNFFITTGFHGVHVLIGTIFLAVCLFRAKKGHFAKGNNHLGFEFAAWYWHFVDVVWLFLFIFLYVLSN